MDIFQFGNYRQLDRQTLRHRGGMRGFSLIELMIAISLLLVVAGISFISLQPMLQSIHLTNAYNITLETTRQAREWAVNNRRTYLVRFAAPSTITITLVTGGVPAATPLRTMVLPNDVTFVAPAGLPGIGPDSMGTGGQAIQFDIGNGGPATDIYFTPDGSARDSFNNINNGVVYMALLGRLSSTRAISLIGTEGKLRGWRLNGASWSRQ